MARKNPRCRTPVCILSLRRFKGEGPTGENDEPARKKTETRTKAEAGKTCMPGRRVEERVKSNEATKGTRGSQQPSKGRAEGRGHGRHTASTTPHRDTGEGSTRGTGEEWHRAPRHARHRHNTHRTHPTSPNSPPSGRADGGGTAPDLRRPSQWWKAPPPGDALPPPPQRATPARKGARCGAGAGSPRPHRPHPGHTGRGTLDARSRARAAGGGTAPDTRRPSQRWQATPPGDGPTPPPRHAVPTGHAGQGDSVGPPHPHTRAHSTWVADPNIPPNGRAVGGGTAPDLRRPSQWWKAPPPGTPFRHPHSEQRRPARAHAVGPVLGPHARTDRTRDTRVAEPWPPAPEDGRPGEGQHLTPGAPHSGGRQPPPGTAPHHPRGMQPPQGMQAAGTVLGSHTHTPALTARGMADPNSPRSGRGVGGGTAPGLRRPRQWSKAPPQGTAFRHPHSEQRRPARAHAVGPVLGPHARTDRTRDTRVAEPWLPAPEDGRPGEGQRLTPGAPHNGGRPPPPGDGPPPHPQHAAPTGHAGLGVCVGPPHPHTRAHSTWVADPDSPPQWAGSRGRDSA